jgi:cell division septal protein FtsQ
MVGHTFSHREEYKKHKRNARLIRVGLVALLVVVLVGVLAYVAHRPSLRVSQVQLSGGVLVSHADVQAETLSFLSGSYLWLFPKNNIFLYPHDAVERDLQEHFKRIDTVSVGRANFHTLNVTITERKPVALWCDMTQCYFMDDQSTIFAVSPDFSGDAYFKYYGDVSTTSPISENPIGAQYIASSTLFAELSQFVNFATGLGLHPQYIVENDSDDFTLVIGGGGQIYFDTDEPFTQITGNLQALLARTPVLTPSPTRDLPVDYIDLRYGNKLFYKLSGASSATTSTSAN